MDYVKRLEKIMSRLRSRNGCPWDKKQTHKSLKPYLLEETHEVLEAIDGGGADDLQEELGDLFLQVVFHAQLAKEKGKFNLQGVAKTIGDKLVRRHPHVFGNSSRKMSSILKRWEELKQEEKPYRKSVLDGLPKSLPALHRAQRMFEKTAKHEKRVSTSDSIKALEVSWNLLRKSLKSSKKRQEKAMGEFLLLLTLLAQNQGLHAEMALKSAAFQQEQKIRNAEKSRPS